MRGTSTRLAVERYLSDLGFCPHTPNCGGFNACVNRILRGDGVMFTKLSVLIPTRKRIDRLRKLLRTYDETTRDAEWATELVFRIDADDKESQDFLIDHIKIHKVVVGERMRGYHSLPQFFNEMATSRLTTGDVLMCGNDDMVFKTRHWGLAILDAANEYPDGIFDLGVTTYNETHYPFSVVSRLVVERMGFIFDPRIFWGDIFLRDVMGSFGRLVMLPHVEIDHEWAGKDPDATFLEGNAIRMSEHNSHHQVAVDEAVEKLRELVRG